MPTKDINQAREQAKKRMVKYRQRQKGVTIVEGVTPQGVTEVKYNISILPPERVEKIKSVIAYRKQLGLEDDSKDRWARAISYREYELGRSNSKPTM